MNCWPEFSRVLRAARGLNPGTVVNYDPRCPRVGHVAKTYRIVNLLGDVSIDEGSGIAFWKRRRATSLGLEIAGARDALPDGELEPSFPRGKTSPPPSLGFSPYRSRTRWRCRTASAPASAARDSLRNWLSDSIGSLIELESEVADDVAGDEIQRKSCFSL
jgi:hypothetical protein